MKTTITILLTIFISIQCNSQIQVYLKNGEMVEGNIGKFKEKSFKLKQNKKGKSEKFKADETDSILFVNKRKTEVYHSVQDVYGRPRFYKLHIRGKLNAYKVETVTASGYGSFKFTSYPVKKPNDEKCINLHKGGPYWSNFAATASEYFEDCPSLSEKIKNREKGFKKDDTLNIVEYYNNECE